MFMVQANNYSWGKVQPPLAPRAAGTKAIGSANAEREQLAYNFAFGSAAKNRRYLDVAS